MKDYRPEKSSQPEQPEIPEIVDALARRPFEEARAERLAQRVVRRLISDLRKMNDPSMLLSGDDSGLKTAWDEICVQRQVEESYAWDAYETTLVCLIDGTLAELPYEEQVALWLLTSDGSEWLSDHEEDTERPVPYRGDTEDFLLKCLLSAAEDYSNQRIRAYAERNGW